MKENRENLGITKYMETEGDNDNREYKIFRESLCLASTLVLTQF